MPIRIIECLRVIGLLALAVLTPGFPATSFAQSFRGTIRGTVTDPSGAVVPATKITARNVATGESREASTSDGGVYTITELSASEYELTFEKTGFLNQVVRTRVSTGADSIVDAALALPGGQPTEVRVNDTAPLVEASNATLSQVVDRTLVQELPLNGRDFGKLVALTPGVTVEGSGVAGTEKGFGQFNINGNRDRSNNYTLDGTDNNDPWFNNSALNQVGITGAPATLLPLDAIQEFNLQSNFAAEYGRNSGSIVNIVTRSGSNAFHASLYEYFRNSYFDARNYFNTKFNQNGTPNPQSHFNNNNFGGSVGGPIVKDRTFFFAAYEGQRERVGSDFNLFVPTPAEVQLAEQEALANSAIIPNGLNPALAKILQTYLPSTPNADNTLPASVSDKNDNNNLIARIDHQINSVHSLTGRYAFGQDSQIFPLGSLGGFGSGSRLGAFAQRSPTRVQVASGSLLSVLNANHVNEVRFGYSRFRNSFGSLDDTVDPSTLGINLGTGKLGLPEFDFNGSIENLGATIFGIARGRISQTYQILDNFTWTRGRHSAKFGAEYRRALIDFSNDNFARGLFSFNSAPPPVTIPGADAISTTLANYFLGNGFAEAETGNTARNVRNNGLSFFALDDIRVRPNFTLNLGLRWEYFSPVSETHNLMSNLLGPTGVLVMVGTPQLPRPYTRDLNNFGPRLGFAWSVRPRTIVRSSYGIYYDYVPLHLAQANFTNSAGIGANPVGPEAIVPLNFDQNAYNGTTAGAPVFTLPAGPPVLPSIFITDHNLRTPYVQSWSLNVQQELGNSFAVEAGYVGTKGTKLVRLYDLNQNGINPNYSVIDVLSSGTSSTYHAGQFTARLQNWHRLSGFSTYTFSKSLDGASDGIDFNFAGAAFPQDSTNLRAEKGPSTFDTRHRWTTAINYQVQSLSYLPRLLAEGWQLNSIITVQSGRPIPVLTGGGINGHQRPDVVPGQPFTLPNWTPSTGYLNPNAFATPAGNFGDLGRDQIYGPGFRNLDFSISKLFKLKETAALQFRAEFFNIFNHPNFSLPNGFISPGSAPAGTISSTPDVAQGNPGLGGGGPRVLQFALRVQF
ncbi:MAG TPA: carboxypeptidase regulatory-like domain-containing protein [Candidatus Acidoferrum sp.]|nr:carboxypeptidase regulatory-like domain-containing protein [Candidatus Acidoferrum sp.]